MATRNSRDVTLGVGVAVTGGDDLKGLSARVRDLVQAGETAAPGFIALADSLDAAAASTAKFREAERAASQDVNAGKSSIQAKRDALKLSNIETDTGTKKTAEYQVQIKAARLAILEEEKALRVKREALQQATAETKSAISAERALVEQLKAIQAAYQQQGRDAASAAAKQAAANGTVSSSLKGIGEQLRAVQTLATVAVGGQLLGGVVGDVAKAADEYKNLAARIKLATGEGHAFDTAFQGVFDVATRTNTAVEQTGTLFTRIAQAGAAIGVSNADALRLTETINQAVQIGGASAESSNAAITQLIQGLQSGVLRGDEFNSVMEQSPRLAKALADGLGVTTGALRKLAETGTLTAVTVIKSLQGQSSVLQAEFATLPATVGRAIQSLSNEWTRYVGEVDKAHGISSAAAGAINALAHNLDTLGTMLYSVGKAAAAYQAVKLAQTFLGIGTAARTATAEIAALTAAQTAAAASSGSAAAGASRFAGLLASIKAVALIGILVNLKEIGTAIGEGAAKWVGYGKVIEAADRAAKAEEETTRANSASKAELAQRLQLAGDKALGLTDVSRKMVGEFDEVITKGGGVSEALDKVAKSLDLKDLSGISNAGAALDALAVRGKIGASDIQTAYAAALKSVDLTKFATEAAAVFDGSEQGARRLKAALDAISEESLRRAGTSLAELKTGFSTTAASAINDVDQLTQTVDKLELKGGDAGRALAFSLDKATDAANTERAVNAVIQRFEELGKRGLISGDQLAQGLQKAKDKLDQILPGVNTLSEALHTFGLKSAAELTQTANMFQAAWDKIRNAPGVTLADQLKAFEQYKAAATAAAGATGKLVDGNVRVQEEILRMRAAAEAAGKSVGDSMDAAGRRVENLADNFNKAGQAAEALRAAEYAERYSNPKGGSVTGSSREERLAGQAATDGSGAPALREKQRLGTLTADDLKTAEAVLSAAKFNKAQFDANPQAFGLEGTQSISQELNSALTIFSQVQGLALANAQRGTQAEPGAPQPPARGANGVRTLVLNLGGRKTAVNMATPEDADNLTGFFRSLESASGVSA